MHGGDSVCLSEPRYVTILPWRLDRCNTFSLIRRIMCRCRPLDHHAAHINGMMTNRQQHFVKCVMSAGAQLKVHLSIRATHALHDKASQAKLPSCKHQGRRYWPRSSPDSSSRRLIRRCVASTTPCSGSSSSSARKGRLSGSRPR